jgi:hydrogenase small subunit
MINFNLFNSDNLQTSSFIRFGETLMITRREFLDYCRIGLVGGVFSTTILPELARSFENKSGGKPPVLWLQGSCCSGCSVSLLNSVETPVFRLLHDIITLAYHPTLMVSSSEEATRITEEYAMNHSGEYILVVEGAVPRGENGLYCSFGIQNGNEISFMDRVSILAKHAAHIAAVGTCASFGGIPAAAPNPTGACGVQEFLNMPVINIPGCPPHPDWIIGTLAHLILYGLPELDGDNRPTMFFGQNLHEICPNVELFDNNELAGQFGETGCLGMLGCKGPLTNADCPSRRWNNARNWCIGSGSLCFGCTEPGFPDEMSPFYS